MYRTEPDPYCYPGSSVLKNKAGSTAQEALDEFEAAMTFARSEEPLPVGDLSEEHYREIHRHLFQDVFEWAGDYRTVRISKGESVFCYPEHIEMEMEAAFIRLKEKNFLQGKSSSDFASEAAHFLAGLNAIHPFREGNGRIQLTFLKLIAVRAGHGLDLERLDQKATLEAVIASFSGNERPLTELIKQRLRP